MKPLKRLLVIFLLIPAFFIGAILWIFTGKNPIILLEKLINW